MGTYSWTCTSTATISNSTTDCQGFTYWKSFPYVTISDDGTLIFGEPKEEKDIKPISEDELMILFEGANEIE